MKEIKCKVYKLKETNPISLMHLFQGQLNANRGRCLNDFYVPISI